MFLFAIKAYDPVAKKESEWFTGLSRPVYVEDPTLPAVPQIRYADLVLTVKPLPFDRSKHQYTLHFEIGIARRLTEEPFVGYAEPAALGQGST